MSYERCPFCENRFKVKTGEEYKFCCSSCYRRFVAPIKSKYGLYYIKFHTQQIKKEILAFEKERLENAREILHRYSDDYEED